MGSGPESGVGIEEAPEQEPAYLLPSHRPYSSVFAGVYEDYHGQQQQICPGSGMQAIFLEEDPDTARCPENCNFQGLVIDEVIVQQN